MVGVVVAVGVVVGVVVACVGVTVGVTLGVGVVVGVVGAVTVVVASCVGVGGRGRCRGRQMIDDKVAGWLKEFLYARVEGGQDKKSAEEIVETFRALWKIVKAGRRLQLHHSMGCDGPGDPSACNCGKIDFETALKAVKDPARKPNSRAVHK